MLNDFLIILVLGEYQDLLASLVQLTVEAETRDLIP